jgi:SAM-dependent methyltransferase
MKVVEEIITRHDQARRIFDPFCGTGTTALSAAYHGQDGFTIDINPFLIWLARAKVSQYSIKEIALARDACDAAIDLVRNRNIEPVSAPPIHKIERWWKPEALDFLRMIYSAIHRVTSARRPEQDLLKIAFCRTLISLSNAAFNHQSMSFKDHGQLDIFNDIDFYTVFIEDVTFVLKGACENPSGSGTVVFGDSRNPAAVVDGPFDLVVTSPPYANRMSYIRELRPYMYWLGFLLNGRDAGELDWTAIGGTWGIATSRLMDWKRPVKCFENAKLSGILDSIAQKKNKNGVVLANYIKKYFDDMWTHFQALPAVLAPGAEVHYIVGNSTFYESLISTEQYYAEMLRGIGFDSVECRPIRKRNSKKELIEFDVVGTWRN